MIEYEVIILDVDPEVATVDLNQLAALGWTVRASYAGDRVIIEREKPVLVPPPSRGILRAINEPRSVV